MAKRGATTSTVKRNNKTLSQTKSKFRKNTKHIHTKRINIKHESILNSKRKIKKTNTPKNKESKPLKKLEEEIDEIENENELFDADGYYKCEDNEDLNDDWGTTNIQNYDILFQKMNEVDEKKLDSRVIEAYTIVGDVLKTYTSGKLPKAFNIIPATENWEDLLEITKPEQWSPQAMYEGTVMFSSNLNATLAEKFYTRCLLPSIRNDIKKNKKLNIHYYKCLKKAIFKPSAFFKGLIIPLARDCNAKEASIIGSILKKCSIPVTHSSACIMKFLEEKDMRMGYLFFMKILLLKKYALPTPVKSALVNYFYDFINRSERLPVLWHQTLLIFVQIYKFDLTEEERNKIKVLINKQNHHLITEDIIRELNFKKGGNLNNNTMLMD
jgi:essential nuclear protein 1